MLLGTKKRTDHIFKKKTDVQLLLMILCVINYLKINYKFEYYSSIESCDVYKFKYLEHYYYFDYYYYYIDIMF